MKEFTKRCLINYALVVIAMFAVQGILHNWNNFYFIIQLLLATVTIHLGKLLTDRFTSKYYILEILVEFTMVIIVVFAFNTIFHWFSLTHSWIIVISIVPIYVVSQILDIARAKRDIEFINRQIKQRDVMRKISIKEDDDNLDLS